MSGVERWAEDHRLRGHHPCPAPTPENPERWECKCDPDAVWTAIYRIHTREQIAQKFAHLSKRDTPKRKANREHLQQMIAEWQAEQEQKNVALAARATDPTRLAVAPRYARGIARPSGPRSRS